VLRVDEEKKKISLGLNQLSENPWSKVGVAYKAGQTRPGKITRLAEFGAFVELELGIEGLAHIHICANANWKLVAPGFSREDGDIEIMSIDLDQKRIGVAMVGEGSALAQGSAGSKQGIVPGARLVGKIDRHEKFGVFVFLAPGRTGLVPLSETGVTKGSDVQKTSGDRKNKERNRMRRTGGSAGARSAIQRPQLKGGRYSPPLSGNSESSSSLPRNRS
jgi:ribosomal protein S1